MRGAPEDDTGRSAARRADNFLGTVSWLVPLTLLFALPGCDRSQESAAGATSAGSHSAASVKASARPAPSAEAPIPAPKTPLRRPAEPLNVLLITIDSLRQDMPWTGYERPIAPNLTELSKESIVYTRAYATSSYTAKSVAALLSGHYPSSLYRNGYFFTGYSRDNLFFTELLQKAGIRTIAGHAHGYFGKKDKHLDQGFDIWKVTPGIGFDSETDKNVTSDKLTELAEKLLGDPKNTGGQFFTWLHYMDPHDQYIKHDSTPDFGKNNRGRYDSEVYFTDHYVGQLLDFCKKQPWWKKTAVIISADHGEAFGEHDVYKHAFDVWDVITRVPLMVHLPKPTHRVIEERRSHIDLAPTVLDLMGQPVPDSFPGHSLVPELYGAPAKSHEPIVLDLPADSNNPPRRAIIEGDYKLTVWGAHFRHYLYNLKDDPGEAHDLAKKEPEKLAEMKALYDATWKKIPQVLPYGGMKLTSGRRATGPTGPEKSDEASAEDKSDHAKPSESHAK